MLGKEWTRISESDCSPFYCTQEGRSQVRGYVSNNGAFLTEGPLIACRFLRHTTSLPLETLCEFLL